MKTTAVSDAWQDNYQYSLTCPTGEDFHPEFKPELTPREMLDLGVFGGSYFFDKPKEFPKEWFKNARLTSDKEPVTELNFFEVSASQPLQIWLKKGWINQQDPRGWFQWYCRYYLGRRTEDDERQIKRWKAMNRHVAQVQKGCYPGDLTCRIKQRQALLHWAYDGRKI